MYSYRKSLKSDISDELINTYLIRPVAGLIVWALYYSPITPNQITIASIMVGMTAAFFYLVGSPESFIIAGLLVTLKDVLDSADGQLARAKQQFSRVGRFLDSIGDFIVDAAIFTAIGYVLYSVTNNYWICILSFAGLAGISLRVSFHVFYQVNFLHMQKSYSNNRISEKILENDIDKGGLELFLQKIFQFIYGWQDDFIAYIDRWCSRRIFQDLKEDSNASLLWYSDIIALRVSGLLGFGTELFILMLCSVLNQLELYLYLNLFLMNGIMLACILYRRFILSEKVMAETTSV
jgi:hypothetical protein